MTKFDLLNSFMRERLTAAVNEILDTVSRTMQEYEEETTRIRKENDYLKEMLKVTGCSFTETTPGDVSILSSGKQDCIPSSEQESEPLENLSQHHTPKKEKAGIKTEPCSPPYPADPDSGSEPKQTDNTTEPLQGTSLLNRHAVDQEMMDYDFSTKVKLESLSTEPNDTMDNIDISNQSWSPQNWDLVAENNYQNRAQQISTQQPCSTEGVCSAESTFPNQPVEFQAAFSNTNRTICNNRLHCTSRHCELQKRPTSKSSPVWEYFSLKEGDCSKAVCHMCNAVISRGIKEYTTSALLKHLRMKHGKCLRFCFTEYRRKLEKAGAV